MVKISEKNFFTLPDGRRATLYTLQAPDITASFCDYGATIVSLKIQDKNGILREMTLGFENPFDYLENRHHFGATIGRYANRIHHGKFTLDGRKYRIPPNNPYGHAQHGGPQGFHQQLWETEINAGSLTFSYLSPAGDQGFPGNLPVQVNYSVTESGTLQINYHATTDRATVLNLTNHVYFNLSGDAERLINDHQMFINSASYLETDTESIPTGRILPVAGTPLDFNRPQTMYSALKSESALITAFAGIDHNYVLNQCCRTLQVPAAEIHCQSSGITMRVFTTEPALGVYTGNFLGSELPGKHGMPYQKHAGLCLEAQHYPDSVNHPEFPSTILHPGEEYTQTTIYRFSTE
jgi:aldose 1-epimerase